MVDQVEGQTSLSDEYAAWREEAAMGKQVTGEELFARADAASELSDGAFLEMRPDVIHEDDPPYARDDLPEVVANDERGLIVAQPQHHLIAGMAALARMDESEFEAAMVAIETGQRRMRIFQQRAMTKGEDYGVVKGIDRPFLHLPGAEKMTLLYGLACRQEAERITGDGISAPPLTYHVKTYVHVGSFDGPIVAMGYGEASSWEVKYRYVNAKPTCPNCGREGLVKRKTPPNLAGKWNCPSWQNLGGCNAIFEANDPQIASGGKVENTDPWSLAETLLQMAAKRSFVAATRRATGTSGLFTQDEDSPSVQAQSDGAPDDGNAPTVERVEVSVARGGKADAPTPAQIGHLAKINKEKDLGPDAIAAAVLRVTGKDAGMPEGNRGVKGRHLLAWLPENLTADEFGALLHTLDTGDVTEATAPDKATN